MLNIRVLSLVLTVLILISTSEQKQSGTLDATFIVPRKDSQGDVATNSPFQVTIDVEYPEKDVQDKFRWFNPAGPYRPDVYFYQLELIPTSTSGSNSKAASKRFLLGEYRTARPDFKLNRTFFLPSYAVGKYTVALRLKNSDYLIPGLFGRDKTFNGGVLNVVKVEAGKETVRDEVWKEELEGKGKTEVSVYFEDGYYWKNIREGSTIMLVPARVRVNSVK